jgi:uncharacterized protein
VAALRRCPFALQFGYNLYTALFENAQLLCGFGSLECAFSKQPHFSFRSPQPLEVSCQPMQISTAYEATLLEQRRQRATMLLGDQSWLTLAGLFWLHEGDNTFGKAADNDILLPGETTPASAGVFQLDQGVVTVRVAPGVTIRRHGDPITVLELQPDSSGQPDLITLGDLTLLVLQRGARYAIRLYDKANPARQQFTGLNWYPVRPAYRLVAQFTAYDPPHPLVISDVIGDTYTVPSPGFVTFLWQGETCQLDAEPRGERLFFNFADLTNGDTTHGAGRFLYADPPVDGQVVLDFNQATNPFCAYTPYATCPLPPPQNRLPVRIEAGEQHYRPPTANRPVA